MFSCRPETWLISCLSRVRRRRLRTTRQEFLCRNRAASSAISQRIQIVLRRADDDVGHRPATSASSSSVSCWSVRRWSRPRARSGSGEHVGDRIEALGKVLPLVDDQVRKPCPRQWARGDRLRVQAQSEASPGTPAPAAGGAACRSRRTMEWNVSSPDPEMPSCPIADRVYSDEQTQVHEEPRLLSPVVEHLVQTRRQSSCRVRTEPIRCRPVSGRV